jgi:hypothetical protein
MHGIIGPDFPQEFVSKKPDSPAFAEAKAGGAEKVALFMALPTPSPGCPQNMRRTARIASHGGASGTGGALLSAFAASRSSASWNEM